MTIGCLGVNLFFSVAEYFTRQDEDEPAMEFDALPDYVEDPKERKQFYDQQGIISTIEMEDSDLDDDDSVFDSDIKTKNAELDKIYFNPAKQIIVKPEYWVIAILVKNVYFFVVLT